MSIEGHTTRAYDGALSALHVRVVEMGGLVLAQVREVTAAYSEWDATAARRVLEREPLVNGYDVAADEETLRLIARRQPMAGDLRTIIGLSKCVAELERAGDEAKKIALTVLGAAGRAGNRPAAATSRDARQLGRLSVALLRSALEALDRLDAEAAVEVVARDMELDAEYASGLRRLLTRAMEDPRSTQSVVEAAFVLKSFERIGDHARNLARHVRHLVQGAPPPDAAQASQSDAAAR